MAHSVTRTKITRRCKEEIKKKIMQLCIRYTITLTKCNRSKRQVANVPLVINAVGKPNIRYNC